MVSLRVLFNNGYIRDCMEARNLCFLDMSDSCHFSKLTHNAELIWPPTTHHPCTANMLGDHVFATAIITIHHTKYKRDHEPLSRGSLWCLYDFYRSRKYIRELSQLVFFFEMLFNTPVGYRVPRFAHLKPESMALKITD